MPRCLIFRLISLTVVVCLVSFFVGGCRPQSSPSILPAETFEPSPTPPSTLSELIDVLATGGAEARIGAAQVIAEMGTEAEEAVPVLIDNLSYEGSYGVRLVAANALGAIGPAAKRAIPVLISVMRDDFVHTRSAAAKALGQIGDKSAVPALAEALYDEKESVRMSATEAISLLTGEEFTENITLDENGISEKVKEARRWWEDVGQHQNWSE